MHRHRAVQSEPISGSMDTQHAIDATEDVTMDGAGTHHVLGSNLGDADARQQQLDGTNNPQRISIVVATEQDILESSEELLFLEVRSATFAAIWIGMVCIHVFCGTILALQTRLYIYMTSPYMSYYVHLIEPNIVHTYRTVAGIFGVLSVIHWHVVLRLCYYSITQRTFAFFPATHYDPPLRLRPSDKLAATPSSGQVAQPRWMRLQTCAHNISVAFLSRRGLLGVESPFFYVYFYLRESIELTSQIYQAYRASLLVARPWLNNLSVAVIVVNCVSTPLVQFVYKKSPAKRRVYLLAIDAMLDFVIALVVPLSIFAPYARAFDTTTHAFASEKTYNHKWFVNAVLENQEIFVVSTLDLCFKIIPHVSIRGCLKKVRALVRKDTTSKTAVVSAASDVDKTPRTGVVLTASERSVRFQAKIDAFHERQRLAKVQPNATTLAAFPATTTGRRTLQRALSTCSAQSLGRMQRYGSRLVHKYAGKVLRVLFVFVGGAIALVHGLAFRTSYYGDKRGCWQTMRPWFATKFACSVYEVNCIRLDDVDGTASQVDAALRKLQPESVAALLFTHCRGLEISPVIRTFPHLLSLDVYNSTLRAWRSDAALTQQTNPLMLSLSFVRSNFTDGVLPAGLTSGDFPTGLLDVEISTTNLVDLPHDLDLKWHRMTKLYVEHSQLTMFPLVLERLHVEKLSLVGNGAITALSDDLFRDDDAFKQRYFILALSKTSLEALPPSASASATIQYLHVHSTQITTFPDWVTYKLAVGAIKQVYAYDTPFCAATSSSSAVDGITCRANDARADPLNDVDGFYPLAFIDALLGAAAMAPQMSA